jgi:hypothetical protein
MFNLEFLNSCIDFLMLYKLYLCILGTFKVKYWSYSQCNWILYAVGATTRERQSPKSDYWKEKWITNFVCDIKTKQWRWYVQVHRKANNRWPSKLPTWCDQGSEGVSDVCYAKGLTKTNNSLRRGPSCVANSTLRRFTPFMEPEVSLPCLEGLVISPCPTSD